MKLFKAKDAPTRIGEIIGTLIAIGVYGLGLYTLWLSFSG